MRAAGTTWAITWVSRARSAAASRSPCRVVRRRQPHDRREVARRQLAASDGLAKGGKRLPPSLEMLVAQRHVAARHRPAGEGQDAHEAAGQHFEQMPVDRRADFDLESGLLAHFAPKCCTMI